MCVASALTWTQNCTVLPLPTDQLPQAEPNSEPREVFTWSLHHHLTHGDCMQYANLTVEEKVVQKYQISYIRIFNIITCIAPWVKCQLRSLGSASFFLSSPIVGEGTTSIVCAIKTFYHRTMAPLYIWKYLSLYLDFFLIYMILNTENFKNYICLFSYLYICVLVYVCCAKCVQDSMEARKGHKIP